MSDATFYNPHKLSSHLEQLEAIEKASLRLVVQAILDYREYAKDIFSAESDLVADIGEDITREALDRLGMSRIDRRLFGKVDYKRARYLFLPEYAVRQALFVDSKAEKVSGENTATLQTSQFSLKVRQLRNQKEIEEQGKLPCVLAVGNDLYITTTIFVKYNYEEEDSGKTLKSIRVTALPNGFLQERYNPTPHDGIWLAGRNAPTRGEEFRVRLKFASLQQKAQWRVQTIYVDNEEFEWQN
ncbi:MAG: BglI family type II restriction endonuclease [Cyanothece sp. SIO2G6]|nr:BglI family type II restriction endonuclease [Cyanothece sp. SIO2G6]